MKSLIFGMIFSLIAYPALAGTYKNISESSRSYIGIDGVSYTAAPGEEAKTYQVLDILEPEAWEKVNEEPYPPGAVYDNNLTIPASSTVDVAIDPNTKKVKMAMFSGGDILVFINSMENPFPIYLRGANNVDSFDEETLINDKRIHRLYFQNLSDTVEVTLLLRVIP